MTPEILLTRSALMYRTAATSILTAAVALAQTPVNWSIASTSGPTARHRHAMAYDSARHVTVLFGGHSGSTSGAALGDTWEWDGNSWTQINTTPPPARHGHAMVYDSVRSRIVMIGGYGTIGGAINCRRGRSHLASTRLD